MHRLVVPVGVVCSTAHLILAPVHAVTHPVLSVLVAITSVLCLLHLGRLWRVPDTGTWIQAGLMAMFMTGHGVVFALLDHLTDTGGAVSTLTTTGYTSEHVTSGHVTSGHGSNGHHTLQMAPGTASWAWVSTVGTATGVVQTVGCLLAVCLLTVPLTKRVPSTPHRRTAWLKNQDPVSSPSRS